MLRSLYTIDLELTYNTWTDVASDWRANEPVIIERGMAAGENVAQVGTMTVALHNPDGRYTPGHANVRAGFDVGILARMRATDNAAFYVIFTGRIAAIEHHTTNGQPFTVIRVEDEMAAAQRVRIDTFPLMLGAAPEAVIDKLIDMAFVAPELRGYWRLGHAVASKLNTGTKLSGQYSGKSFGTGKSEFAWVGDTWHGVSVREAIREVCDSEGGYFYSKRMARPSSRIAMRAPSVSPPAPRSAAVWAASRSAAPRAA